MAYLVMLIVLMIFVTVVDLLGAKYLLRPARVPVRRDGKR
jgi:hypothetical protein